MCFEKCLYGTPYIVFTVRVRVQFTENRKTRKISKFTQLFPLLWYKYDSSCEGTYHSVSAAIFWRANVLPLSAKVRKFSAKELKPRAFSSDIYSVCIITACTGILILTLTRADVGFELSLILQSELIC